MLKIIIKTVALTGLCMVIISAKARAGIALVASPTSILADGISTSSLFIYETACSTVSGHVSLSVSGPGTAPAYVSVPLVQFSTTSSAMCGTPYYFSGQATATLTSTQTPGTVIVTASAYGLPQATVMVQTRAQVKAPPRGPLPPIPVTQPNTNESASKK